MGVGDATRIKLRPQTLDNDRNNTAAMPPPPPTVPLHRAKSRGSNEARNHHPPKRARKAVKTTYRIPKPPAGNGVHQLPCKVQGVHRLSHREIIDDVADIEHQHCNEKGTSVDEVMRGIRYPDLIKQRKTSELEKLNVKITEFRNEVAKAEREIIGQKTEKKALAGKLDELRESYTRSVRNSESNRVNRVADSEKSLQGSKRRLRELKEEIREEQVKCTAIWKTTIKQKALCAKTSAELQALTRKHEHYITRSKDNIDIITKKTHKYEEEKAAIETELKNLDGTLGKLDEELKELRKEASESQQMVAKQKKSLVEQAASNAETILKLAKEQLNGDEGGDSDKEEDNGC
eukprot:jgi/Bigna1/80156/fgenesh1_pg.68_\